VQAFGHRLEESLNRMNLPSGVRNEIQANQVKLGGLQPPSQTDVTTKATIQAEVRKAFVSGFRVVMAICACLAAASAGIAWRLIPSRELVQRNLSTVAEMN
jgi:hypothetical protein